MRKRLKEKEYDELHQLIGAIAEKRNGKKRSDPTDTNIWELKI